VEAARKFKECECWGKSNHTTINQMASTTTKNMLLSQPKIGQSEIISTVTLTHTVINTEEAIEIKAEVPGVDPSTIEVSFEDHTVYVRCEKGVLSVPVTPVVDITRAKADIVWGMLTLIIPLPEPPASGKIKVSIYDTVPVKSKPSVKPVLEE
jgi:HSP20 family molecular chaperone IbpA